MKKQQSAAARAQQHKLQQDGDGRAPASASKSNGNGHSKQSASARGAGARHTAMLPNQPSIEAILMGPAATRAQTRMPMDESSDGDTGLNAVLELRQLSGVDIPCIVISADDSDVIRDRAKAVGYRFLAKPVNATKLRALVLALTR